MEELEAELREIRSRRLSSKSKSSPKSKCRSVVLQRLSLYVRSKQETAKLGGGQSGLSDLSLLWLLHERAVEKIIPIMLMNNCVWTFSGEN